MLLNPSRRPITAIVSVVSLLAVLVVTPYVIGQNSAEPGEAATAPAAAPGTYKVDPAHSSFNFHVSHLGISLIHGRFNEFSGSYTLGDRPGFQATLQTDSVDTNQGKRDDHLKSSDFFDARQFPTITFDTQRVEVEGDQYTLVGDFTMHGQTHEVTLPLTYHGQAEMQGQTRTGFTGETTIDRTRWGLDAWDGMVGNEITLVISFEGIKQ